MWQSPAPTQEIPNTVPGFGLAQPGPLWPFRQQISRQKVSCSPFPTLIFQLNKINPKKRSDQKLWIKDNFPILSILSKHESLTTNHLYSSNPCVSYKFFTKYFLFLCLFGKTISVRSSKFKNKLKSTGTLFFYYFSISQDSCKFCGSKW